MRKIYLLTAALLLTKIVMVAALFLIVYGGFTHIVNLDKPIAESIGEIVREVQTDFNRGNE